MREAAAVIGVSRMTVKRWADSGRITPQMKLRGSNGPVLFKTADIEALKAEREAERASEASK
ncbi:helix-turn-helix domain-containing protein [Canibacter zhoujuaniae]|uniref:helix-turn-helix domain-containing protein n=1 Tax=Canibacter zhoujuaniae TaxID=2708343 RepID=UPI002444EA6F|nr:helix-turn-helix domain-containing protein [Canibacter zhoujuaniae]